MDKAPFLGSFLTLIRTIIQESQAEMKVKIDEMEIKQDDIKVR
jgi:REP element-mobilizing transposase RayT